MNTYPSLCFLLLLFTAACTEPESVVECKNAAKLAEEISLTGTWTLTKVNDRVVEHGSQLVLDDQAKTAIAYVNCCDYSHFTFTSDGNSFNAILTSSEKMLCQCAYHLEPVSPDVFLKVDSFILEGDELTFKAGTTILYEFVKAN